MVTLALLGSLAVFVAIECSPHAKARRDAARRRRQEGLNAREQARERGTGLSALETLVTLGSAVAMSAVGVMVVIRIANRG
ncbi:MAG: hypothetical protein EBT22_00275 [Chloroflexi bacterium]|nr:hypothetical protein [Chloroflexota bacterium]